MIREILQQIVSHPPVEARLLNTLSLLEFIGARKISKTVCKDHPSLDILKHEADETRHAYIFKYLSDHLSKGRCKDYLCHDEAVSYFQMLDGTVSEWLNGITGKEDARQNYLFVSCLVGRRAMKLYSLYQKVTKNAMVKEEIEKVVMDETAHRKRIEEGVNEVLAHCPKASLDHCLKIEENLFDVFCASLKKEVGERTKVKHAA